MNYPDIIGKVSQEMDIPLEVVDTAYKSYWKFIKQTIQSLPLKDDISEEEFAKLRTNFNIPSLGKLTCTFDRMMGVKKRFKYIKRLRENAES
jgi:hypothetical protein|nr:MAG TPA: hypothetical protein [Crassvirales sp.]